MFDEPFNLHAIVAEGRRAASLLQARPGIGLIAIGEIIYAVVDYRILHDAMLVRLRLAHAALALLAFIYLTVRGNRLPRRTIIATALLALLPLLPIMWIGESVSALSGKMRDPFVGHHLILLGAAVFMPGPIRLVWTVLSIFAASSLLNYINLMSRVTIPLSEPLVTILNLLVGIGIVVLRRKVEKLRELYEEARAAAQALLELAKIARSIRDGASSPLQTISAATLLLRHRGTRECHLLDRVDRAAGRIQKLVVALDLYEPQWDDLEESFDARTELGEQHDQLTETARRAANGHLQ